jgi:hypothetical protein
MSAGMLLGFIILIFIFIKTCSYGIWTWKEKNYIGSVMIFIIAMAMILVPAFKLFIGE